MGITNTKFQSESAAYGYPDESECCSLDERSLVHLDIGKTPNSNNSTHSLYCDVCLRVKALVNAESFCVTCELFTCDKCVSCHASADDSEDHVILRKDEMPTTKRPQGDLYSCQTHVHRPVKYLCKDHTRVCCSRCVIESHSTCGRVQHLPESDFNKTGIYEQLSKRLLQSKSDTQYKTPSKVQYIKDVLARHKNDQHQCWITDLKVLTHGNLALIDHNNDCLKITDVRTSRFVSYFKFGRTNKPWALCQDSSKNIVVTCGYEICILDAMGGALIKVITVGDWIKGVAPYSDMLIYTCTTPRPAVKMVTTDGHMVKSYELTDDGQDMFSCPWSLAISYTSDTILVVDVGNSTVTSINIRDGSTHAYTRQTLAWGPGPFVYRELGPGVRESLPNTIVFGYAEIFRMKQHRLRMRVD